MNGHDETALGGGAVRRKVLRLRGGCLSSREDALAAEVPVALAVAGRVRAVMLATPCDLEDFALGFCLSEGIAAAPGDLRQVAVNRHLEGIELELDLCADATARFAARAQALEGRSGCGLCGAASLEQVVRVPPAVDADLRLAPAAIATALEGLQSRQPINAACGATHAAAWCDTDGRLLCVREDVGRHNALDKLIGAWTRQKQSFAQGFVLLSSRASYEMVMKAAQVGMPLVVAISAPTALAVVLAEQAGVTLVGFAREEDCVVYSHPARIALPEGSQAPG